MSTLRHLPARTLTAEHLGQRVTVRGLVKRAVPSQKMADGSVGEWSMQFSTETVTGALSDLFAPDHHRIKLWVGGECMDVHADATVTIGDLDVPGGA